MRHLDRNSVLFVGIWASGYVVGSIATSAAPAIAITFWRMTAAAVLLTGLAWWRRASWPRTIGTYAGLAVLGVLIFGAQFGGVYTGFAEGMPAGTASLVISCAPLVVAVLQALLGWERLRARQWLGVAVGLLGVVLALSDRLVSPGSASPLLWSLLGLAGFSVGTALVSRLMPADIDPVVAATVECLAAAIALVPWALVTGGLGIPLTASALGAGAWLTVVNAIGGLLVFNAMTRRRGATVASSLLFVVPPVTALVAWPVLGQPLNPLVFLGLAVAVIGVRLLRSGPRTPSSSNSQAPTGRVPGHANGLGASSEQPEGCLDSTP